MFNKLVHRGKIVFVLDGFDEMGFIGSHEQRFEQLNAIWQLATKGNKIIISGRPSYFPTEFEEKEGLNILGEQESSIPQNRPFCTRIELDFFDEKQIEKSINTYYKNPADFEKFFQFVKENKSIFDLCKRASLLHIVKETLPQLYSDYEGAELNPAQLMRYYIEHWVERQLSKSIVSAVRNEKIKKEFVFDFFRDLAGDYYNYEEGNLTLRIETLRGFLKERMSALNLSSDEEVQGFEAELIAGYFIERNDSAYHFVHKSFMEYFVSQRILYLFSTKNLKHDLVSKKNWSTEIENFVYESVDSQILEQSEQNGVPLMCFLRYKNGKTIAKWFKIFDGILKRIFYLTFKYISLGRSKQAFNLRVKFETFILSFTFVLGLLLGVLIQIFWDNMFLPLLPFLLIMILFSLISVCVLFVYGNNHYRVFYYLARRVIFILIFFIALAIPVFLFSRNLLWETKMLESGSFINILILIVFYFLAFFIISMFFITILILTNYERHDGNLFPVIRAYELSMARGYSNNLFVYSIILALRPDAEHKGYNEDFKINNKKLGNARVPLALKDIEIDECTIEGVLISLASCRMYNTDFINRVEVLCLKNTHLIGVDFSKITIKKSFLKILIQFNSSLDKASVESLLVLLNKYDLEIDNHIESDDAKLLEYLKSQRSFLLRNLP